ncbi:heparinase II/III domain-containing protein [Hymenobacter sp. GOD-10R]|uniref:heparinase II/III domain-containing protein n=1 Tax=Hymenobacter sp. GOD-10R TaxID=3093922 RepID=UPI002D774FDE|nr:heparinase II/III family protein [Hymenobacter sp. GOD-10R]WRQ31104.1 heparinase II/III family protein [Hymenobacter sp. GOD-10R]
MKKLLLLVLLVSTTLAHAQVTPRDILSRRYSVEAVRAALLPRGQWVPYPRTPAAWQQALPDSVRRRVVQAGEAAQSLAFAAIPATTMLDFVRNGNRSRYEQASFGKRSQLMTLVLAESVEGQGRFLDAIANGVWSICEESFWGVSAHLGGQKGGSGLPNVEDRIVDLFDAETAADLALTDYFVGEQLAKVSPLVRPRIYYETNLRLFQPLLAQPDRYEYLKKGTKVNNWNPWIMSNWLVATLLLEPDEARRSQMTRAALEGLDLYLNGLGEDGGCDEGPSYWFVAGGSVFDALEILHSASAGKIDVYREPLIRNMASYVYKMHIAGQYFVDFSDADPTMRPDGLMLYRFGQRLQDPTLMQFGRWAYSTFGTDALPSPTGQYRQEFNRQRRLDDLLTIKQIPSSKVSSFAGAPTVWFPDVQVMNARSQKGLFVATHGGHNAESHNHNDVGDFIVYVDGQPVIIDVGRGTYTAKTFSPKRYDIWFNTSQFHNLPIINGLGQLNGREFEARAVRETATKQASTLDLDIAKAYPASAGIQRWHRTVALNRKDETVRIEDDYVLSAAPTSLQQVFMTVCPVNTAEPGKVVFQSTNNQKVTLHYDPALWQASSEVVPLTAPEDATLGAKWDNRPIRRVLLTQTKPLASSRSVFTVSKQ